MENQEMKKPIPVELNQEELNMVAGGGNAIPYMAVNGYLDKQIPCTDCGKLVHPTEVVYTRYGTPYCRDCYEARYPK